MSDQPSLLFLKTKDIETLLYVGEVILDIPKQKLGLSFVTKIDTFLHSLTRDTPHLTKDLRLQFNSINSRLIAFLLVRRFSKFTNMKSSMRERYLQAWMKSRIPLLRKGFVAFRGLCGWGYYGESDVQKEVGFLGLPLGREHETPTLLYGKKAWESENNS